MLTILILSVLIVIIIIIFSKMMSFIKFCIILTMVVGVTILLAPDLVNVTKDFGLSFMEKK